MKNICVEIHSYGLAAVLIEIAEKAGWRKNERCFRLFDEGHPHFYLIGNGDDELNILKAGNFGFASPNSKVRDVCEHVSLSAMFAALESPSPKEDKPISIRLNNQYTAEITKTDIAVGCQRFTHAIIAELYEASKKKLAE